LIGFGGISIFFMAEGNYPFPSNYIPLSMGHLPNVTFPAWPMRVGCAGALGAGGLDADLGIKIVGNVSDVKYTVEMGAFKVAVDWDKISGTGKDLTKEEIDASKIFDLVRGWVDFNGVLVNITGSAAKGCYGAEDDEMLRKLSASVGKSGSSQRAPAVQSTSVQADAPQPNACPPCPGCPPCPVSTRDELEGAHVCESNANPKSWSLITCTDNVDMSAVKVQGVGDDAMWPPSQPRGWSAATIKGAHDEVISPECTGSFAAQTLYGGPRKAHSWGDWIAAYYGEVNQTEYSNIVWSNGALDPWSGGGHYENSKGVAGAAIQKLNADNSSIALAIPLAGHHLDLYFPTAGDPETVKAARKTEEFMIRKWCQKHYDDVSTKIVV